MKRKFSTPVELQEFFLSELKKILGDYARVEKGGYLFQYNITPIRHDKCLWQATLRSLFVFLTKYSLYYYIDFTYGRIHVYTDVHIQTKLGLL